MRFEQGVRKLTSVPHLGCLAVSIRVYYQYDGEILDHGTLHFYFDHTKAWNSASVADSVSIRNNEYNDITIVIIISSAIKHMTLVDHINQKQK